MIRYKKSKKQVIYEKGKVNIKTSFNNNIITVCDKLGNALCWSSAGISGFKGTRKATSYAAQVTTKDILLKASKFELKEVDVFIKGHGTGREMCLRTLVLAQFKINFIQENTPISYNGCRETKKRRL